MHPFLSLAVLGISAGAVSILPSFQKHPLQSKFSRRTFAHRGLFDHLSRPENSLAAFGAAVEHGYGIELDLQMTADGKIVVFHDESLQRICSTPLKIEQSTFAELQKHPLLNSDQTIPLFSEVLQLVDGKVPLIVEIKSTEHYEPLCLKVYDLLRRYPGDYCVESMNPMMMGWFAKNAPQVMRGQLATRFREKSAAMVPAAALSNMMFNFLSKPNFIAYDHKYADSNHVFQLLKSLGAMTVGWTIREQDYADAIGKYDAIIFEGFLPPVRY